MLTALDIWNLALASREAGESTIDPFTGEILDLAEAAFDSEDYFVALPGQEHLCHEQRLLADCTTWVNSGAAEEAMQAGVYIRMTWAGGVCLLWLAEVVNGELEALALGKAFRLAAVVHVVSGEALEVGDRVAA